MSGDRPARTVNPEMISAATDVLAIRWCDLAATGGRELLTEVAAEMLEAALGSREIEATPEMVDVGLEAYIDLLFNENGHERIVTEVFSAMMRARVKSRSQTPEPAQ